MSGIVRRILGAKVSAADLERARAAIDELSPEDQTDIAARVVCLIEAFGQPGRHEVSARVAAIDWRLQALARLSGRSEFRNWPMPGNDGFGKIAANVLEAAAIEPLIEREGEPAFDPQSFLERLMAMTEEKGHG
jgi:hypothetical protein